MKTRVQYQLSVGRLAGLFVIVFLTACAFGGKAQTIVWQDNFESPTVWDNWGVDNGVWEIGAPTIGPATNSIGYRTHEGTNCAATVLAGNYPASTSSRLIRTLPFAVPSASQNPRLEFWHWYKFSGNSYGVVQIKYGTNDWADLSPRYYATGNGVWTRPVVDLKPYGGKAVQIAFRIAADGSVNDGWDVDEVRVIKGDYTVGFTNGLTESFELGQGDWYAETGTWQVGVPTSGPNAAHGGTNCLATVLAGNYEEDRNSRFISPAFVVPADQPRLRFWHWFSIGAHDWTRVEIKVGTNAWQALSGQYTASTSGYWTRAWLDLSAYASQTVQLGFYFESHSHYTGGGYYDSSVSSGWYVDDVVIETGPWPPTVFPEGFETGWSGWRVDYIGGQATDFGIWQIGVPTSGPGSAHSGTNCAATILTGNYPEDRSGRLFSQPFVVPHVGAHPTLHFWHWFSIGLHDFCQLQIRTTSGSWQALAQYTGSGSVWSQPNFDLSPYAGQTVQLGFYFESHSHYTGGGYYDSSVSSGWYVDDVNITSVTPPTGIVEFTDARYFVTEAETNAVISVARRYGSAGSASVIFWATDGSAVGGDDYDAVVEQVDWADGEEGVKTVLIPIHQDVLAEGNETVSLELIVPGALASSVARESATLVIIDDEVVPLPMVTNIAYLRSLLGTTNWVPTNTSSLFTVEGTVTTHTNLSTVAADELFFMQDGTNGIAVLFRGGTNQFMPDAGDRLRVTASLTNINGLLALAPSFVNLTNVVWRLSAGNPLPAAGNLDFAVRTNVPVMEANEARYVVATNVWISQSGGTNFPTALTSILMTNEAGKTFDLTINPNTDIAGKVKPAGPVAILGVLNQNDSTAPYTTNYALLPTRYADIITAPTIVGQPQSRTNGVGSTATFTVTAVGTDPLYYQWRRFGTNLLNGGNVSGATSNLLTLTSVQPADAATSYCVVISNYLGSVTSTSASLTVVTPVSITTHPQGQTVDEGTDVSFTVGVSGTLPYSYQWRFNTSPISGATDASLTLHAVLTNWAGNYDVVVNNAANLSVASSVAVLEVTPIFHGWYVPTGDGLGSFTVTNGVYTIVAGGEDIQGSEDRFFFIHRRWDGDGEMLTRLVQMRGDNAQSEAGIMFRYGMGGGARHVFVALNTNKNTVFRRRLVENYDSVETWSGGTNSVWLRLMRMGDTFVGHRSTDGVNWQLVWWTTHPSMPASLEIGLGVTAHRNGGTNTAVMEMVGPRNLTQISGVWPLPGPQIILGGEKGAMTEFQRVGGFKFLVGGVVGDRFAIKYSGNVDASLATWQSLGTVTNTYGVVPFTDPEALTNPRRFYRVQNIGP